MKLGGEKVGACVQGAERVTWCARMKPFKSEGGWEDKRNLEKEQQKYMVDVGKTSGVLMEEADMRLSFTGSWESGDWENPQKSQRIDDYTL